MMRYLIFIFLLLTVSCKTFTPVTYQSVARMPDTFQGNTDTLNIAHLNWKDFFKDPHLLAIIDSAVLHNPDMLIAIQHIEKANADYFYNKGAFLPSLQAAASAGADKFGDYTMNGVGNFDTNLSDNITAAQRIPNATPDYFLGLRSNWELDLWGKLRSRKKAAFSRFLASRQGRHLVTTALVAQVSRLYYELVALDSELEIVRKNIKLQELVVETITIQKTGGRATELAVQQSTALLIRTRSLETELVQEQMVAENQLNWLLGRYPQAISRTKSLNEAAFDHQAKTGVPGQLLRYRPDVLQAELELQAAGADVAAARAAFLPSFTINAYTGFNAFTASLLFNTPASLTYGVLGGLTAPLLNKNALKSSERFAVAHNKEMYYAYQKTLLTAFQEVVTDMKTIENLDKIYKLREQEADLLLKAVSTSNDLFVAGYANYLEVVTAQKSVLEAEINLIDIRKKQLFTIINLYQSLGGGWQ